MNTMKGDVHAIKTPGSKQHYRICTGNQQTVASVMQFPSFYSTRPWITRQILFTTAYIDTTKQGEAHEVIERLRQIIQKKSRSYKVKGMMEKRSGHLVK